MSNASLWLDAAKWGGGAAAGGASAAFGLYRWYRASLAKARAEGAADAERLARERTIAEALDELRAQMAAVIQRLVSQDRFLEWVGSVVRKPGSDPPPRLTTLDDPWPDIEAEVRKLGATPHGGLRLTDYYKGDPK